MTAFSALRALHLLSMALWFSIGFFWPGDVRRTLARGVPHVEALAERVERVLKTSLIAAFLTLGSGVGMIFQLGGMKALPTRMHAGIGIALLLLGVEILLVDPAASKLFRAIADGKLEDARVAAKKLPPLTGVTHLLKVAVFATMIVRV